MKNIGEFINEQLLTEGTQWKTWVAGSEVAKGIDSCNCVFRGNKKYGFLIWMINEETAALVAVDSAEDWAEAYNMDVEQLKAAFDLKEGESLDDNDCYVMRIW